jgi:DNA-binding transcriptional LysR family regulator
MGKRVMTYDVWYYLLSAKDSAEQPKVAAFRDWLLEETRASRPEAREEP